MWLQVYRRNLFGLIVALSKVGTFAPVSCDLITVSSVAFSISLVKIREREECVGWKVCKLIWFGKKANAKGWGADAGRLLMESQKMDKRRERYVFVQIYFSSHLLLDEKIYLGKYLSNDEGGFGFGLLGFLQLSSPAAEMGNLCWIWNLFRSCRKCVWSLYM